MAIKTERIAEGRTTHKYRAEWPETDGVPTDSEILAACVAHNYGGEVRRRHDPERRVLVADVIVNID